MILWKSDFVNMYKSVPSQKHVYFHPVQKTCPAKNVFFL